MILQKNRCIFTLALLLNVGRYFADRIAKLNLSDAGLGYAKMCGKRKVAAAETVIPDNKNFRYNF